MNVQLAEQEFGEDEFINSKTDSPGAEAEIDDLLVVEDMVPKKKRKLI